LCNEENLPTTQHDLCMQSNDPLTYHLTFKFKEQLANQVEYTSAAANS